MKRVIYIACGLVISLLPIGFCQEAKIFMKLGHSGAITSIAFSPDGQFVISGSEDNTIRLWNLKSGEWKKIFKGHRDAVSSVLFSDDGKTIFSGSRDGTTRLWNIENGEFIREYEGHKGPVVKIAAYKDSLLITGSVDQTAKVWSISTGKLIASMSHLSQVHSIAVKPGNALIVASGSDEMIEVSKKGNLLMTTKFLLPAGRIKIWTLGPSASDLGAKMRASEPLSFNYDMSFTPDGKYLVAATGVGTIDIWNYPKSELIRQIRHSQSPVLAVSVSPDGQKIAGAGEDGTIRIFALESGTLDKEIGIKLPGPLVIRPALRCVAYSPDGKYLAFGGDDNNIYLWNTSNSKIESTMRGSSCSINSVAFSPDGKLLATGSADKTVKLWNLPSGDLSSTLKGHGNKVTTVAFSPNGIHLASGSYDSKIKLWDIISGETITTLSELDTVNSLSFDPEGDLLASAISGKLYVNMSSWGLFKKVLGKTLKVWDPIFSEVKEKWLEGSAYSVSYSPSGTFLAFGLGDGHVLTFDLNQQLKEKKLGGFKSKIYSVAFNQNGQRFGAASGEGLVKIWETTKWKERNKIKAHSSKINSITFSPDDKYFVTGGQDGIIKLWSLESGNLVKQINFHDGPVNSIAFSPDGEFLASGSMDGSVCLWETETGNMAMRIVSFRSDPLDLYIVYTGDNYFRCSPSAEKFIYFKENDDVYKLSDYLQKTSWQNQPERVVLK